MSRETLSFNKHDSTCGIFPYLTERIKSTNYSDDLFLNYENFDYTGTFIQVTQESRKRGVYFLDTYDGLKLINVNSKLKFYSQEDTLRYLDFNIAKHLRRIEAQIKMGNECSYCTKILNSNLYNYKHVTRTGRDISLLYRLRFQRFKDLVKKIDFLVGITPSYSMVALDNLCAFYKEGGS